MSARDTAPLQALGESTAPCGSLDRRGVAQGFLAAFTTFALLGEARAAAPARRMPPLTWIQRQDEIARALAAGQITPRTWMTEAERLAGEVDVAELMACVNRQQLSAAGAGSVNDPKKRHVRFVDGNGAPRKLSYGAALFDFAPGNVITPHGHRNMVSAHLVVAGALRIRNYDRVGDEAGAMVVRPTRDYVAGVGRLSTMSTTRDNIHWFTPNGGPAATFDVVISGLDPALPDYEIKAIDPRGGRRRADGAIVAPIIGFDAAARLYTADV